MLRAIVRGPTLLGWSRIPVLMRAGILWSAFIAGIWAAFIPLALFNIGTYTIDGRVVAGRYFLVHAYPELSPMIGLLIAISYGFCTERQWARSLPIWFWASLGLLLVVPTGASNSGWPDAVAACVTLGSLAALA